eukprot:CAMPEP_0204371602 /NCGR_PEP_ID=MMETSP0469-20131031/46620_1 /ASSEMBLY_ACC=CAM_ASM_000384 /TAXON_ID=2969 /ORGANISM="Oxyrrhis marina" /LENGTH=51 /DNA_ID=CAMNT_0051361735 /DNA_START=49 /DNA_END=201 /DNA_ORIENTATION=+
MTRLACLVQGDRAVGSSMSWFACSNVACDIACSTAQRVMQEIHAYPVVFSP